MKTLAPEFYFQESAERQVAFGRERPRPMLIGLAGKKESGKSTIAEHLQNKHGFERVNIGMMIGADLLSLNPIVGYDKYAEILERYADIYYNRGYEGAKTHPRYGVEIVRLLQDYGKAVRGQDPDFWLRSIIRKTMDHIAHGRSVVVENIRFRNEADWLLNDGGLLFKVYRKDAPTGINSGHVSETDLDDYQRFTDTIVNRGTVDELQVKVDRIVELVRMVQQ